MGIEELAICLIAVGVIVLTYTVNWALNNRPSKGKESDPWI